MYQVFLGHPNVFPETKSFELLTDTPETLEGQELITAEVSGWGMWFWLPGKAKDLP